MEIKLTKNIINKTNYVKFLGEFIDDNLKWTEHFKSLSRKHLNS